MPRSASFPIPVLLIVRELNLGGVERDVSKYARHLADHGFAPHVASFASGGMRAKEIEQAGIPLLHLPVTSFKSPRVVAHMRVLHAYLRRHRIQVLHAFDSATCIFGVPVARFARVPVALSSQLCYRELSPPELLPLLPWVDRLSTGIFVNCKAIAEHMTHDYGIAPGRIHVCYNGFEPAEFHPAGGSGPGPLPKSTNDANVVIGTVAVLREEKNLAMLIDAFAAVHRRHGQARLVIVGNGPLREELEQRIRNLHLAGVCSLEPATAAPADWMRAMDVFVLPSRSEAFSNALLEAMACGCCPVGSRVGGTPELIEHNQRGLLFEPGNLSQLTDALMRLAEDREARVRMAAAAADFAHSNLTIEVAAARLASIYNELLARSGSTAGSRVAAASY